VKDAAKLGEMERYLTSVVAQWWEVKIEAVRAGGPVAVREQSVTVFTNVEGPAAAVLDLFTTTVKLSVERYALWHAHAETTITASGSRVLVSTIYTLPGATIPVFRMME